MKGIAFKLLTILIKLSLWIFFSYLSINALIKYLDEPVSSQLYETLGDEKGQISFPYITICNENLANDSEILSACGNGTVAYANAIANCLKKGESLNFTEIVEKSTLKWVDYFQDFKLVSPKEPEINFKTEDIIEEIIDWNFGVCLRIDSEKIGKGPVPTFGPIPRLSFIIKDSIPWKKIKIVLHDRQDFPDAFHLQPLFTIEKKRLHYSAIIQKKISKLVNTKHSPCGKYSQLACMEAIQFKQMAKYGCDQSFVVSDNFIDENRNIKNLPLCNLEEMKTFFFKINSEFNNTILLNGVCQAKISCQHTKYRLGTMRTDDIISDTKVTIAYAESMVQHLDSSISYDLQSLISEVGGALGLTLGISGLSIYFDICNLFLRFCHPHNS